MRFRRGVFSFMIPASIDGYTRRGAQKHTTSGTREENKRKISEWVNGRDRLGCSIGPPNNTENKGRPDTQKRSMCAYAFFSSALNCSLLTRSLTISIKEEPCTAIAFPFCC